MRTLSTFLYHGLVERGVTVECICARHVKGVLSARVNKSDVHDAEGLAQLARTGWYKRVHMKASATHIDRAALHVCLKLGPTLGKDWWIIYDALSLGATVDDQGREGIHCSIGPILRFFVSSTAWQPAARKS